MTQGVPVAISTARENRFDPPVTVQELRAKEPLTRLRFTDGRLGWLATGYSTARAVLADPRFGARGESGHPAVPRAITLAEYPATPPGMPARPGDREHQHYRKLLAGQFTARRIRLLTEWTEKATAEHLDAMEREGSPADLLAHYALPLSARLICELLGVPHADRERFRHDAALWSGHGASAEEITGAFASLGAYLHRLVELKRARPADDVLSGLIAADPALTDDELTALAFLLLLAGHESTAHQLGLGVFALLDHPAQLAALRADRSLTESAAEELLRYLSVVHHGPTRAAREDAEIGGTTVRAGEVVVVCLAAANRDPQRFPHPERLDITRDATGHLAFGHGIHQCLGAQLARITLRAGLTALLDRLPGLRLAVPAAEVPLRHDAQVHGVHRLPVAW
ncbi:cytochrome P450 [Streptomyces sp. NPDC026206]|uniref:cytochrome P450 n=1 Tax=Streptomyces sp. NPDC026206 TaxID=3157089 RepID=UPI0033FA7253